MSAIGAARTHPGPAATAAVRLWLWLAMLAALLGALLIGWQPAAAQPLRPVPALTARVIDQTGTLSAEQRGALEAKLAAFEQRRGTQMVVLMVPTTAPEDVAAYAFRVADQWKIGRREVGDGLLIVVAKDDRKMLIEVARALEGAWLVVESVPEDLEMKKTIFRRVDELCDADAILASNSSSYASSAFADAVDVSSSRLTTAPRFASEPSVEGSPVTHTSDGWRQVENTSAPCAAKASIAGRR